MNREDLIGLLVKELETLERPDKGAREIMQAALRRVYEKRDGRVVEKRDGRVEPYDGEKLALSIARASDEAKRPMPQGDLSRVVRAVEHRLGDRKYIPSEILRSYVLDALAKEDPEIETSYASFRTKRP